MKKPIMEYRWEAVGPDGTIFKRGPAREDIRKVAHYVSDLRREIADLELPEYPNPKRHLAPYWRGATIRVVSRAISPWTQIAEVDD